MAKQNFFISLLFLLACATVQATELEAKLNWADMQRYGFAVNGVIQDVSARVGEKVIPGFVLAKLDPKPFKHKLKQCQSAIKKLEPAIADANLALEHAYELFERSVLSEVELQQTDGKHSSLVSEKMEQQEKCQLDKWRADQAVLKANQLSYILNSNLIKGSIISEENKSSLYIELVSAERATAIAYINYQQKKQFKPGDEIKVIVDQQSFLGKVSSIELQKKPQQQYQMRVVFLYKKMIEPGKAIKLSY